VVLSPRTSSQIDSVLADLARRRVDLVRVLWSDLHGVARGKDIVAEELPAVLDRGVGFCQAVLLTDLGATPLASQETSGRGWPDAVARPDLTTLAYPDYAPGVALCLADLHDVRSGQPLSFSPRDLLRTQVERLTRHGLHPVLAPELEFYLCRPDDRAAHGFSRYVDRDTAGYTVGVATDPSGMLPLLLRQCRALGLRVFAGNQEFGGGQFEINHIHSDAMPAADGAFLFKHAVKEIACQAGLRATFMGKPFTDGVGSGSHIHLSLTDGDGATACHDPDDEHGLSPVARAFLAGLIEHAPALTAILNPTINAFKRLRHGDLAPTVADWGPDNRTAFVRVPPERGAATRLEVRVGDGTTNPYLAFAALLAAGFDGVERDLTPPAATDPGEVSGGVRLPDSLDAALTALTEDKILAEGLGGHFVELYTQLKRQELDRFARTVTDWEFHEYSWLL
jgi:glutamine synthetase